MYENLSKVLSYIRGCAKSQAYDDVLAQRNGSTSKMDYKTLAKGSYRGTYSPRHIIR